MNRRTLIIIASIVVALGLIVGIYFLFFRSGATLEVGIPNPFGSSGDREPGDDLAGADGGPVQGAGTVVAPKLMRITDGPVAKGSVALYIPPVLETASSTVTVPADIEVRFIERASGNVYAFRVHDRVLTRISNRTIPGVQEASWTADGSRAFARYLTRATDGAEHIDTYALLAEGGDGYFLEQDLDTVTTGASSTVFTLLSGSSGSTGTLSAADGTNVRTLFTSGLARLQARFSGSDIIATTNASSGLDGYAFLVSRANGSFTRLLGPLRGLATLPSPDGSLVLYSYTDRGKLATQVLDVTEHTAIPLPLGTFAEKCAWIPNERALYCAIPTALSGNLPDDWYQGAYASSDRIWRIDLNTRLSTLIIDPKEVGEVDIDAVSLALDPTADVLIFTNKRDGSLWSYDL